MTAVVVVLDWFGIIVFAVTGALVASRKQMDIFGFMLLAAVTGVGGGTVRDLLLGVAPVFWVSEPRYLGLSLVVAVLVFFTAHIPESRYRLLLWLDAVGLSFFCVVGAERGLEAGISPLIAVVMGVVTATFGGIIRDILGGESPLILRREIYVTAALAGAGTFVAADAAGLPEPLPLLLGFALYLLVRGLALAFHWSLPPYRPRPGRDPDELRRLGL